MFRTDVRNLVVSALVTVLASSGCKSQNKVSSEQDFVAQEVTKLKAAFAKRDETRVAVGCITATLSLQKVSKTLAAEIEQLCYVDAPKLHLEIAVADVRKQKAASPDLGDLVCMQLFAADAFKAIIAHPSDDPGLKAVVDEYTALCPARVATFRAR